MEAWRLGLLHTTTHMMKMKGIIRRLLSDTAIRMISIASRPNGKAHR
jgi:hypothetical protein